MALPPITRRTALRGFGAALALPWLEAMAPAQSISRAAEAATGLPKRMAYFYVPNGVVMPNWTPEAEGSIFTLPSSLSPLSPFQDDFLVLTGLTQDNAYAHGDGPGDHARALACFLTGTHPRKTDGANIAAGTSVDQIVARKVGQYTRLPSLELGIDPSAQAGSCDSGYSCAYSSNISWSSETTPVAKETNPRLAFERIFGRAGSTGGQKANNHRSYRSSILDTVADDARRLRNRLGSTDGRKLDEYLAGVREIERRIDLASQPVEAPDGYDRPTGVPSDFGEHARLMMDMIALAFQADVTRVATFVLANEGSNRSYGDLGVPDGHHEISHHGRDEAKLAKLSKINTFHIEQFAYLLGKLKGMKEGDGSVLDQSMLVYGSGIGDGDRHNHNDLPVLLAGRGGGSIQPGRHVKFARNTPLNNLFLSMLDRFDCHLDALGDSTEPLGGLEG